MQCRCTPPAAGLQRLIFAVQPTQSSISILPRRFYPISFRPYGVVWGEDPIVIVTAVHYRGGMNLLIVLVLCLLLFGGGGLYFGGPFIGGGGIGLILLICLIIYCMGGFRTKT